LKGKIKASVLCVHPPCYLFAYIDDEKQYSNYGLGDERVRDVFGENYERLQKLKAKYDPDMVFHKWFPITPKA
jgi:FAD/FMN-containing dehydrogenase